MAGRRGNGEGSITKLKNGLWMGRVTVGRKKDGKLDRKSLYGSTRAEVSAKMIALQNELQTGSYISTDMTLGQWLTTWLKDYKLINLKPKTYDVYETQVNCNIIPDIGDLVLKDLKQQDLQRFYNKKYNNGNGLSGATIRKIHNIISSALNQAVDNDLMHKNVSKNVQLPKLVKPEVKAFTLQEQNLFFEAAKEYRLYNAFVVNIDTGLRSGELLALTWKDVDLVNGMIRVNKNVINVKNRDEDAKTKNKTIVQDSPKTEASNRTVPLTKRSLDILKEMYKGKTSNIVFPSEKNTYISLRNYQRTFYKILEKAGLEKCSPHVLRHSFVTRCFEQNVQTKVISEMVGHAKLAHTTDIYTHIMFDIKRDAVNALDKLYSQSDVNQ
jgi:integrase